MVNGPRPGERTTRSPTCRACSSGTTSASRTAGRPAPRSCWRPDGAVGAVDVRGGAPGTRDTDLLDPSTLVQRVNAICLTGGSGTDWPRRRRACAGWANATTASRWARSRTRWCRSCPARSSSTCPAAPGATGRPPISVTPPAKPPLTGPVAQGCVGAGSGAKLGRLKGGVGTASVVLPDPDGDIVIGALVVANAAGNAVDHDTGRPYAADLELADEFGVTWPDRPGIDVPRRLRAAEHHDRRGRRQRRADPGGMPSGWPWRARTAWSARCALRTPCSTATPCSRWPPGSARWLAGTSSFADPGRVGQLDRCARRGGRRVRPRHGARPAGRARPARAARLPGRVAWRHSGRSHMSESEISAGGRPVGWAPCW